MTPWVAECPYCGLEIEGTTQRNVTQRRIGHIFGPCDDDRRARWDNDLEGAYRRE